MGQRWQRCTDFKVWIQLGVARLVGWILTVLRVVAPRLLRPLQGWAFALEHQDLEMIQQMRHGLDMAQRQTDTDMTIHEIEEACRLLDKDQARISKQAKKYFRKETIKRSLMMGRAKYVVCDFINRYITLCMSKAGLTHEDAAKEACRRVKLDLSAAALKSKYSIEVTFGTFGQSQPNPTCSIPLLGLYIRNALSHSHQCTHKGKKKRVLVLTDRCTPPFTMKASDDDFQHLMQDAEDAMWSTLVWSTTLWSICTRTSRLWSAVIRSPTACKVFTCTAALALLAHVKGRFQRRATITTPATASAKDFKFRSNLPEGMGAWYLEAAGVIIAYRAVLCIMLYESGTRLGKVNMSDITKHARLYPAYLSLSILCAKALMCGPYEELLQLNMTPHGKHGKKSTWEAQAQAQTSRHMGLDLTPYQLHQQFSVSSISVQGSHKSGTDTSRINRFVKYLRDALSHGHVQQLTASKLQLQAWKPQQGGIIYQTLDLEIELHGLTAIAIHSFIHVTGVHL